MSEVFANGMNVNISIQPENANDNAPIQITVLPPAEGPKGEPGFSPKASVKKTATGAVITVEDEKGITSAAIENGKDGKDGAPGKDGYTPQKGVDYFDGAPGKDGYTPQKGVDYFDGAPGAKGDPGDTNVFLVREIIDGISNKPKEEAEAAAKAGKAVMLVTKYGEVYTYYGKEKIPGTDEYAQMFVQPITKAATGKRRSVIYLRADNALLRKSESPFTAVAENPLIIKTGDTETSYDGSEKKEIEIVDNVFIVKLTFDEDYNFVVDKTQAEVKQAVADGKAVIMLDVEVGTTLLYMGEGTIDGERCPFFVSPLSEVGMTALLTNVVYLKESGEVVYQGGPPINPLIIHYGDEQYTFDGSELLSLNIKDDVFVIRVDKNGKADQTQAATIAAKDAGKAVLLVKNNGEVYTFLYMNVHPDYTSDYCPVFTSAIYGDFGETKYRSLAYLLSDKTVVTRTESINTSGGSGGGGSGLPATTDPHQMLVTDSDGKTAWEERTHYHSVITEEVLPEYTYKAEDAVDFFGVGELAIKTPFFVLDGAICDVNYNGKIYKCKATVIDGMGILGNAKAMNESLPGNDEPFLIASMQGNDVTGDGVYGLILPLDGVNNGTISIRSVAEKLKKIPDKFLPDQEFGKVKNEVVFLPETTVQNVDGAGYIMTPFDKIPEVGQSFIATFDGVDYECTAYRSTNSNYKIAFGDSKLFGGVANQNIPFGVGIYAETSDFYQMGARFFFTYEDENAHTLKVHLPVGYVQRVSLDYIPKSIAPVWIVRSTEYDAMVNGNEAPAETEYYSDLTPTEIIDLIKTGTLGGMMLYYWSSGGIGGHIVNINDIQVIYRGTDDYVIEGFSSSIKNSDGTFRWTISYDPTWNTYQVSCSIVT